jgi:nucleoid-associated protein YgaU
VKNNDDLWKISEIVYGNGEFWTAIAMENNLVNPDLLFVGQELLLPSEKDLIKGEVLSASQL